MELVKVKNNKGRKNPEFDFIVAVSLIFAVFTLIIATFSFTIANGFYSSDKFMYSFLMLYFAVLLGYFMSKYLHQMNEKQRTKRK